MKSNAVSCSNFVTITPLTCTLWEKMISPHVGVIFRVATRVLPYTNLKLRSNQEHSGFKNLNSRL